MTASRPGPAQALHDTVLDDWGLGIVSGRFAPGSRISAEEAVNERKVSRTVVREAVRVLESMGLVTVRRRVGITVCPPENWNSFDPRIIEWRLRGPDRIAQLHAISELRAVVEPLAARLAATRGTPADFAALTEAAIGMSAHARQADGPEYLEHDATFHRTLLRASGNVMLASLADVVVSVLEGRTKHDLMPSIADSNALRLHLEVAAAVQAGDPEAAETAMRAIVSEADDAVQALG